MTPEDARRDLVGFVRGAFDEGPVSIAKWQWELLEAWVRLRAEQRRARMRGDGWVTKAGEALARLEQAADQELVSFGVDMARGPDRTAFACSCGFAAYDLEDLANHAIRGHRWPEADGTL